MMGVSDQGWAVWFVGLPGCGKTTLAIGVYNALRARRLDVVHLQMDKRRKVYFPEPKYTREEREKAYLMFVEEAAGLVREGKGVLMDGAAYELSMRTYARQRIVGFAEVFVQCSLNEAIERESGRNGGEVMAGMYRKALERRETGRQFEGLGDVIGVDVEFQANPDAEFVIDNSSLTPEQTLEKTLHFLDRWLSSVYMPAQAKFPTENQ